MRRIISEHSCPASHVYGYDVQKRVNGKVWTWRPAGTARNIEEAEMIGAKFKYILVRCNGCGAELLREYPVNDAARAAIAQVTGQPTESEAAK